MKYLVTGKEMSLYDKQTSEHFHIPSVVLMEQAAHAFVESILQEFTDDVLPNGTAFSHLIKSTANNGSKYPPHRVLVVCGTGNNGGDGIAIARLLNQRGIYTKIYAPVQGHRTSELFDLQYKIYREYGYPVCHQLETEYFIIIDAIFGTGLARPVTGSWSDIIDRMNTMPGHKISVDIASGVSADTGEVLGTAFRADETITFSFAKLGQYLWPGAAYSGKIIIAPIGITEESFLSAVPEVHAIEDSDLKRLPSRKPNSHKGTYGKLLVIAGSAQMAGAAIFAAKAAYRMGTGLVKVMTPESNRIIIQAQVPEAILCTYDNGIEYKNNLQLQLLKELKWADALVIGPGIGTGKAATEILRTVLHESEIPMVLDADALNIISREGWHTLLMQKEIAAEETSAEANAIVRKTAVAEAKAIVGKTAAAEAKASAEKEIACRIIITPHLGEMSRLTAKPSADIKKHICEEASQFAKEHQVVCVLKDARTVTALPDGQLYLNLSGNNGMATAGSGDVLSGILGGLLAQGLEPAEAAPLGVYFHGKAGDTARDRLGARYMMASDIIEGMNI